MNEVFETVAEVLEELRSECSKVFSHAFLSFECVWESYVF